jgi:hypothetical protein
LRHIQEHPRAEAEAVAGQGQAADLKREQRRRHMVRMHKLERLAPENARAVELSAVGASIWAKRK